MRVAIVGLGLIGGSIALDLQAEGFAKDVVGVDANEKHCAEALRLGLVHQILSLEEAASCVDFVVLAVPVTAIEVLLPKVLGLIQLGATVTDVGSTKRVLVESVKDHPRRRNFVPSHPMAGTENSGPAAALKGLFSGKTAVICDVAQSNPVHVARVEGFYDALGMRKVFMGSEEHDVHAAYVSHLSHISSFVLANTVLDIERDVGTIFDLAGGGFESTVRLAKSSPLMWRPVFEQNREPVVTALSAYISRLVEFQKALESKRWEDIEKLLSQANEIRRVLENINSRKGPSVKT